MNSLAFIPPPVVPIAPAAINVIVPTGGLLAGAAAGAKAGVVLGPKGAVVGAIAGALLLPLLLPGRLAPGTLPGALDPGLNEKESPEPGFTPLDRWSPSSSPQEGEGETTYFQVTLRKRQTEVTYNQCFAPEIPTYTSPARDEEIPLTVYNVQNVRVSTDTATGGPSCDPTGFIEKDVFLIEGLNAAGQWITQYSQVAQDGTFANGNGTIGPVETISFTLVGVKRGEDPIPDPIPDHGPGMVPKPRPQPVPIKPLPKTVPSPAPVPLPDPEPQPEPLRVPNPADPKAPPVVIPKAPPAKPVTPTKPARTPIVTPAPLPAPVRIVPITIPSAPPATEPRPQPQITPAPSPSPLPGPGPVPLPQPDPSIDPGKAPEPVIPTPPTPNNPPPVQVPIKPENPVGTTPGGTLVPQPTPPPITTPPDVHYPVKGGKPVTPGGARADIAAISKEVGRIEQKTANLGGQLSSVPWPLLGLIYDLLTQLIPDEPLPGDTYRLTGVCEKPDDEGNQPVFSTPVLGGDFPTATLSRLDAMQHLLQAHLAYRTPTCRPPELKGDWRTISFISDETSPYGKSRLRKRLRYRSQSGIELGGLVDHWANFVWAAGPVCVQHSGSSVGTPQVWAASANEGKRVLRHAFREAGIDPDQVGEWTVSGSNNPRYGVSGTMRVNTSGGYYWITERLGSNGRPLVQQTSPIPYGSGFDKDK